MNPYQETHNLKQEIRRLRLTIQQLHTSHAQEVKRLKAENESLKKAPPAQPAPVCEARRGWLDEVAAENERRLAGR